MKGVVTLIIILQLAGSAVILAEIFIPSGGLLSLLSAGLFGWSLYLAFTDIGQNTGLFVLMADLFIVPAMVVLGFRLLARSPATLASTLSKENGVVSQAETLEGLMDREGVLLTDLRPAGTALIDGNRVDVTSRGEFVEKDSRIVVCKVTANKVFVRKIS